MKIKFYFKPIVKRINAFPRDIYRIEEIALIKNHEVVDSGAVELGGHNKDYLLKRLDVTEDYYLTFFRGYVWGRLCCLIHTDAIEKVISSIKYHFNQTTKRCYISCNITPSMMELI